MRYKYFKARNLSELKKEYRELLKIYHPDNGGDLEAMKEINAEFEELKKILPAASAPEENTKEAQTAGGSEGSGLSEILKNALEKVQNIPGINIEICGLWLWVSGNTYPVKDALKAAGFMFSGKKKMWYFHEPKDGKVFHRKKEMDMESIRSRYGSTAAGAAASCLA